ncbi:lysozyme [Seinonella peptonophila]|uniref:Lysozyme n=1 Tax=Seinonella peptonophila TaxID=112248 RepID=A0A1M4TD33_9BACL|nr:GH25 family lysozyme [Seinonella peptonophila]SHE42396.1 lysozyme [Seinonella peptonophila]
MKSKQWQKWMIGFIVLLICVILEYYGLIWHNSLFASFYEVKGLDISNHQATIDWSQLKKEKDLHFVYIKATEGADFTDRQFYKNWQLAHHSGLAVGAYHFFSMQSTGQAQAAHFIQTVPKINRSLPPVVDIEIHLKHDQKKVDQQLQTLLDQLEKYYQQRPLLYVTYKTYNRYIKGKYNKYPLWIRDIVKFPTLENRKWLFWQFSNRGHISGIQKYVDLNVFRGTEKELFDLRR